MQPIPRPETEADGLVCLPRTQAWVMTARRDPARAYRVSLAWPEGEPPAAGFPVLYLLDGDAVFATALGALRAQEGRGLTPAVLVGLGYPTASPFDTQARRRDYTAPGANAFLETLEQEVLPAVEARFRIDAGARAIFGHSLGGLFVLHVLFTRIGLFRHHIAASPSLWWNEAAMLATARRFADAPPIGAEWTTLLLTNGSLESDDPRLPRARRAQLQSRRMGGNAYDLAQLIGRCMPTQHHEFVGESHASVLPAAIGRALHAALARPGRDAGAR